MLKGEEGKERKKTIQNKTKQKIEIKQEQVITVEGRACSSSKESEFILIWAIMVKVNIKKIITLDI